MRSSGGPTVAFAPWMPGIVWHAAHPYFPIADWPRSISPPVIMAASLVADGRHPPRSAAATRTRANDGSSPRMGPRLQQPVRRCVGRPECDTLLGLAQPRREQRQAEHDEDHTGGNPHQQPGELLIRERVHVPRLRLLHVIAVPRLRRDREQR